MLYVNLQWTAVTLLIHMCVHVYMCMCMCISARACTVGSGLCTGELEQRGSRGTEKRTQPLGPSGPGTTQLGLHRVEEWE